MTDGLTIQKFKEDVDSKFNKVDQKFDEIDKRFDRIDARFERIDARFEKIDAQFDKLTRAMINGFADIYQALDTKADKKDFSKVYNLLDKIAKQQEIDRDERIVMGYQLDRHDSQIREIAAKMHHKLSF